MSRALLRAHLPPLALLTGDSRLRCAWLDRHLHVLEQGNHDLTELAALLQGKALELCLHPEDSLLAVIELPPLPAARLSEAVALAADGLLLSSTQELHLVHGPRNEHGQVQLAWLDRAALRSLVQRLRHHGLQPRGLYAAPYFFAVTQGHTGALGDGHLLVRHDAQRASVHALPEEGGRQLGAQPVYWVGEEAAPCDVAERLAAEHAWTGPAPACNLLQGVQQPTGKQPRWGRAIASCAMAAMVWTVGLNLYAARLADEGQMLKRQMVSRVQAAFPELPVILNPLQQARQQRDARVAGAAAGGTVTFAGLVQQGAGRLPFMSGAVQQLDYDGQQLQLTPRNPTRKAPADSSWQSTLAEAGLEATLSAGQWTLRPLAPAPDAGPTHE